ncbi:MAG TPA: YbhB/YbcL family Raf kinase inhibitor-like protein [Terriglobales bacterium]|nr:YbhB/YbcL family Raf kinase inhibitor-like protein [Terriglobales bacterium]
MSSFFQHEGKIPASFTCDGENISPELSWRDAPDQTQSFVLLMHDPDAPRAGGFTHWVLYNIPASVAALEPNVTKEERLVGIGVQGKNDSGKIGYMGPCPPSGTHRYFVRLYALDIELNLKPGASTEQVQKAMRGHVLDQAELMGRYARRSERAA